MLKECHFKWIVYDMNSWYECDVCVCTSPADNNTRWVMSLTIRHLRVCCVRFDTDTKDVGEPEQIWIMISTLRLFKMHLGPNILKYMTVITSYKEYIYLYGNRATKSIEECFKYIEISIYLKLSC